MKSYRTVLTIVPTRIFRSFLFPVLLLFAAVLAGVSLVEDGRRQQEWQWYLLEHHCTFDRAEAPENPALGVDVYRCRGGEEIRRTSTGEVVEVSSASEDPSNPREDRDDCRTFAETITEIISTVEELDFPSRRG